MTRFYSKYLGKTLATAVEEAQSSTPAEQLAIYEELALIRVASREAVALYGIAMELPLENEKRAEIMAAAALNMKTALGDVIKTCQVAAQIESAMKDKVSVVALQVVVEQIVRVTWDVLGAEHQDLAEALEEGIRTRVRLPSTSQQGTTLTPDMDALEMDATVPLFDASEPLPQENV